MEGVEEVMVWRKFLMRKSCNLKQPVSYSKEGKIKAVIRVSSNIKHFRPDEQINFGFNRC